MHNAFLAFWLVNELGADYNAKCYSPSSRDFKKNYRPFAGLLLEKKEMSCPLVIQPIWYIKLSHYSPPPRWIIIKFYSLRFSPSNTNYLLPKKYIVQGWKMKALTKERWTFDKKAIQIQISRNVKLISWFNERDINLH